MIFKKILSYLTFRKQEGSKSNLNLRMMHGMNRISMLSLLDKLSIDAEAVRCPWTAPRRRIGNFRPPT